MKIKITLVIAMLLLTLNLKSQILTPVTYIEKYDSLATNLMDEHGIPASIILGISFLESGYGNSKLSSDKNNYFGVKTGKYYKEYENDTESFQHFCDFISKKSYYDFLTKNNISDHTIWIEKIKNGGYAESPEWSKKVLNIIKKYKLYELDKIKRDDI